MLAASVLAGPDLSSAYVTAFDQDRAAADFARTNPGAATYEVKGRTTVYGKSFAHGADPIDSAQKFVEDNAAMFGVLPEDLAPIGPFDDGHHLQGLMYDRNTNTYKFTGIYYTQEHEGIEVFRSRLMLLVRNEAGFPMVLAGADLRNLGAFDAQVDALPNNDRNAFRGVKKQLGAGAVFGESRLVIWAGVEGEVVEPRLAHEFEAVVGSAFDPEIYERWLYLVDAHTGDILFQENRILHADVVGNTSGMVTQGIGADICYDEELEGLPYMRVSIEGGATVDADVNGDFVIPNGGDAPVTVISGIEGTWFNVNNFGGADTVLEMTIDPNDPANFIHNEANNAEFIRGEVNPYLHANVVRDFVLNVNPGYPTIGNQTSFPVNANVAGSCNAFYDFSSINFFRAGGGCPNEGHSTIVYHEYGHHLIAEAGSGQGEYGEGMSDCIGVIITDDSRMSPGFFGNCDEPLRDADNTCQYVENGCSTCGAQIHSCGQLISGCVWSTRNELKVTEPDNYREILSDLTVNSILCHFGTSITPEITIHFLTLDDDDGNLLNGSPHYDEIAAGFGDHGMDAPEVVLFEFDYPNGLPDIVAPAGGTTVRVEVVAVGGDPVAGSGLLHVDIGDGFEQIAMDQVEPNVYDAVFPPSECTSGVSYFFTADDANGETLRSPEVGEFATLSAVELNVTFEDDFEDDLGWSVSGNVTAGEWERATLNPDDSCDRGDPDNDADGSGMAYVTEHDLVDCNSDVDGGTTTLTSPIIDASQGTPLIAYWRWYSNAWGDNPFEDTFVIEVSDDGGGSWVTLETVGPEGEEADGGWFWKQFYVEDFVELTDEFRIRFVAADTGASSVVEAAVDGVELIWLDCDGVVGDIDGDGLVGTSDLLLLLGAWGDCADCGNCPEDLDGNCNVGTGDLLLLLGNWG